MAQGLVMLATYGSCLGDEKSGLQPESDSQYQGQVTRSDCHQTPGSANASGLLGVCAYTHTHTHKVKDDKNKSKTASRVHIWQFIKMEKSNLLFQLQIQPPARKVQYLCPLV